MIVVSPETIFGASYKYACNIMRSVIALSSITDERAYTINNIISSSHILQRFAHLNFLKISNPTNGLIMDKMATIIVLLQT